MKTTAIPLPTRQQETSTVPIFKIIFAKKGMYVLFSFILAALAFLSAGSNILTYCSPFALALVCAVPEAFLPAAVIGSAAGYVTAGYEIVPARYLAALILAVILRRIFSKKTQKSPLFSGIIALVCSAASGIVTSLLLDEVQVTLIPYLAESFIAAAVAVFWAGSVQQLERMKNLDTFGESETACLLISVFILILSLSYIKIYLFSPAHILAYLCILISAYYGKMGAGALAGIGGGIAFGLGTGDTFAFAGLSIGGLFAGLGAAHSKLLSAIALEAGIIVPLLFGSREGIDFIPFAEAGIAALIFFCIPKKAFHRFRLLRAQTYSISSASVQTHTVSRLRYASDALGDVCRDVYDTRQKNSAEEPPKITSVYINTMQATCDKCGLKYYCWEREKAYTVSIFKKIEKMLAAGADLTPQALPNQFGEVCIRSKVLIKNFTKEHTAYMAGKLAARHAQSMRDVMSVQFDALSQLLYDLSEDIEQKEIMDAQMTDSLLDLLEYCGVNFTSASVLTDKNFRIKIHIKVPYKQEVLEKDAFLEDLESICRRSFESAYIYAMDDCYKISFFEKALLRCECAAYQIHAYNNTYCGDAVQSGKDYSGKTLAVLADGMGSGYAAHLNASLSAGIMEKLICSGFSVGAAIKIVNAALMVKDSDESFSTLDLVQVDTFTGKTDFYKAGASFSLVVKNGESLKVELSGMPVGILDKADFSHSSLTLGDGDRIILVSDGVTQGNCTWIAEMAQSAENEDARALAKRIAQRAHANAHGVHEDDISVAVIAIHAR